MEDQNHMENGNYKNDLTKIRNKKSVKIFNIILIKN